MKECYENMQILLDTLKSTNYNWKICGDLKVVGMLMRMQSGFTKYCCFICLWHSCATAKHYVQSEWPLWKSHEPGECKPRECSSAPSSYKTWPHETVREDTSQEKLKRLRICEGEVSKNHRGKTETRHICRSADKTITEGQPTSSQSWMILSLRPGNPLNGSVNIS